MTTERTLALTIPESDTQLMEFYEQAWSLRQYAETRIIATNEDLTPATEDLAIISSVKKGMEEKRKEYLRPFQDHVKETNDAYKLLMGPIEEADKLTRSKVLAFKTEQETKRREAERIENERLKLAQAEMELKGEHTQDLAEVEKPEAVPQIVRTDMGAASTRANWKYEIIDKALLPEEYKMPDHTMLAYIAKKDHDQHPIPGVRFYSEEILQVRRS